VWVPGSSSGSCQATTPAAALSATTNTATAQIRLRLVAMPPTYGRHDEEGMSART
jgi:hypothetical protein